MVVGEVRRQVCDRRAHLGGSPPPAPFAVRPSGRRRRQFAVLDAGRVKRRDHLLGGAAVYRQEMPQCAVSGEGEQRLFANRIDGVRRGERLDVKNIGGVGIFCASARPQETLGLRAGTGGFLPAR